MQGRFKNVNWLEFMTAQKFIFSLLFFVVIASYQIYIASVMQVSIYILQASQYTSPLWISKHRANGYLIWMIIVFVVTIQWLRNLLKHWQIRETLLPEQDASFNKLSTLVTLKVIKLRNWRIFFSWTGTSCMCYQLGCKIKKNVSALVRKLNTHSSYFDYLTETNFYLPHQHLL